MLLPEKELNLFHVQIETQRIKTGSVCFGFVFFFKFTPFYLISEHRILHVKANEHRSVRGERMLSKGCMCPDHSQGTCDKKRFFSGDRVALTTSFPCSCFFHAKYYLQFLYLSAMESAPGLNRKTGLQWYTTNISITVVFTQLKSSFLSPFPIPQQFLQSFLVITWACWLFLLQAGVSMRDIPVAPLLQPPCLCWVGMENSLGPAANC